MTISQATPELPVPDVEWAQTYFRDVLGFSVAWYRPAWGMAAVARNDCAIFLRQSDVSPGGAVFWIFAEDVDALHVEFAERGAQIVDPPADREWGLRQFTLCDYLGNTFHFHHDL